MIPRRPLRHPKNSTSNPLQNLTGLFCSWSSTTVEPDDGGVSAAYRDARKFGRPATVTWSERLHNSVSFIGTVEYPFKQYATNKARYGGHTILCVKSSPSFPSSFRILLAMWDTLAERASLHLKPNDYIYVSGHLGSYTKSALQGTERLYYKVTANEFNYVQVPDESFQVISKSGFEAGESSEERHRSRLLLWQLLFAHPDEWYDNRQMKTAPRHPDFKHKSTGEALWLNKDDPPWVKKQIELMESEFIGRPRNNMVSESFPSEWVFDEQL